MSDKQAPYDALLIVSFGGPEGMADVMPFLENVTRGRNIPHERLLEVQHHYEQFGGVSPHNAQIRALIDALQAELARQGPPLPIYWGNRNWTPFLDDTLREMSERGVKSAIGFVVSGFSSYASCRQYLENIESARQSAGSEAPAVDKIRVFYNHPGFIEAMRDRVREALVSWPVEQREQAHLVFTAHSIPRSMAGACAYEAQLKEAARLVAEVFPRHLWSLVYQSRSGPPSVPWLLPDVCDHLRDLKQRGATHVVVAPIGFLSDHLEVLFDLDIEAKEVCEEIGLNMVRAATVGTHPCFVQMICELIRERTEPGSAKLTLGHDGPSHDVCPVDCCPPPQRLTVQRQRGSAPA